jgi:hypothetical protein
MGENLLKDRIFKSPSPMDFPILNFKNLAQPPAEDQVDDVTVGSGVRAQGRAPARSAREDVAEVQYSEGHFSEESRSG